MEELPTGEPVKLSRPSGRELRVERTFNAPRELLWRAHTEPALLARWWARGNPMDVERFELERGGHWRFVEKAPEGVTGFEGRFREVVPKERLSQTFEWDGLPGHPLVQTIELKELPGHRTVVVTSSLFFTAGERDGMLQAGAEDGINLSYAALDEVLASLTTAAA